MTSPDGVSGNGARIPKQSAAVVENIFKNNGFPDGISTTTSRTTTTATTSTSEIKTETNIITETTSSYSKLIFNLVLAILFLAK